MIRYGLTIFLSAFLLFQIQPMFCKFILPWFGGSPSVWGTCIVFFQTVLLIGYLYAHLSIRNFQPRTQAILHALLLLACLLSLVFLPIIPSAAWKPAAGDAPAWRILSLLSVSIGFPYLLLSSTAPLLQSWFSLSRSSHSMSPYRLYALSNLGSLLALFSYPFLVEPNLPLKTQARLWSWMFAVFALCCGFCALQIARLNPQSAAAGTETSSCETHGWKDSITWLLLAACPSVMFLATTNQLTEDIAAVPFLWVLPLSIYLLSFILCFGRDKFYSRTACAIALPIAAVPIIQLADHKLSLMAQVSLYCAVLFTICMTCHGELARLKPRAEKLSTYYLAISAGGALGGIAVTFGAPLIFKQLLEYQLGMVATGAMFLVVLFRDPQSPLHAGKPRLVWGLILFGFAGMSVGVVSHGYGSHPWTIAAVRNFYGTLHVDSKGSPDIRNNGCSLVHGHIRHGFQFIERDRRREATTYYGPHSGVARAAHYFMELSARGERGPLHIGVVGLGAGTLALYGRAGDTITFYEINPEVERIAHTYFTYLSDAPATVDVALGDARMSLERELNQGSRNFDLLALDAFNSDAIPLHLLTQEAFVLYFRHLRPDGVLAVHISNHFLNLEPLVRGLAELNRKQTVAIKETALESAAIDTSMWLLVTSNTEFIQSVQGAAEPEPAGHARLVFTDDYSNLYSLLRKE